MLKLFTPAVAFVFAIAIVACDDGDNHSAIDGTPDQPSITLPTPEAGDLLYDNEPLIVALDSDSPLSFLARSDSIDVDEKVVADCNEAIADIESYRYRVESSASFENAAVIARGIQDALDRTFEDVTPRNPKEEALLDELEPSYREYAAMYDQLLEPIEDAHEGEYLAPGSWRFTPGTEPEPEAEETIVIGDTAWNKVDGAWDEGEVTSETLEGSAVPPAHTEGDYCDGIGVLLALDGVETQEETIDGTTVTHFHLDTDSINEFIDAAPTPDDREGETTPGFVSADMDVWLDPLSFVMLRFEFTGEVELPEDDNPIVGAAFGGAVFHAEGTFEIFDINDPSISIEPPI
jgi:hypothetical protein